MNHNTYSTGYNSKHPTTTESASHSLPMADTQAAFLATWVAGFLMASAFQSIHSHSKMVCYTQNHPFYSRIHHLNENKKLLYAHTANTFKKVQILTSRRQIHQTRDHKLLWPKKIFKKKNLAQHSACRFLHILYMW